MALLLGLLSLAGLAALASSRSSDSPAAPASPAPGDPGLVRLGLRDAEVGRLAGDTYRAGAGAEPLPTVVLLHGEGQVPAAAREVLPVSRPIRVVTVLGRVEDVAGRRRHVDPLLQGISLREALLREADEIGATVVAAVQRFAIEGRVVVVGLGTAGAIALAIGLRGAMFVRAALGAGGTLTADWIPPAAPPEPAQLYKLSWGDAEGFDQLAMATAAERGWPTRLDLGDIDAIDGTPDAATSRAWLSLYWQQLGLAG